MNLDTITSVRLDADAIEKLTLLSQATGLSRSETIRYLIMQAKVRTEKVMQDVLVAPEIEVQHDA